ncbi:MAG: acyloxyacyl hydrolase [Taibaiella sp.]|nr:acyloxyacyl hydrolase [Taibaiella sp.]
MRRVFCFWVATLFFTIGAFAADDTASHNGFGVDCNIIVGRIIRHSAKFTAPVPAYSLGFDANLVWQSCGTKPWQQLCGYPLTGIGILYTDYRSKHIFGKCVGAYPNLQVPIIKGKSLEWTIRFGVGLAYVTKKYQAYPTYDTLNTAVSTHLNAFGVFMTDVRWHINPHWDFQAGVNLTHISNALYREPNLGVNMVGGHIGFRYFPGSSAPCRISAPLPEMKNRWLVETRFGLSHKEARAKGNPVEPAYIGAVYVSKRFKGKKKLFAGVDAAYHKDVYAFLINYGVEYGQEKQHAWDGGIFAGGEYIIGRLGLVGMVGVYYRQTFLDFDPVYQKMGGKYYLISREKGVGKELFISAFLNTHGVVAEYAEFGMGIGF